VGQHAAARRAGSVIPRSQISIGPTFRAIAPRFRSFLITGSSLSHPFKVWIILLA
jgi:hypothetical protein